MSDENTLNEYGLSGKYNWRIIVQKAELALHTTCSERAWSNKPELYFVSAFLNFSRSLAKLPLSAIANKSL